MKKILLIGMIGLAALAEAALRSVTPVVPDAGWTKSWWLPRHEQKMRLVQAGGAPIVFVGDSITHFWETNGKATWAKHFAEGRYRALNLGFSGDRTEHVLWRIAHGELDGFDARAIVLMIGTNNTGHFPVEKESPEDTITGVKAVLDALRAKQPKAKIILCAIFPRDEKPTGEKRRRNDAVNKAIAKFADGKTILWCDFGAEFLAPDGTLPKSMAGDFLHPGPAGYEIWAKAILPYLDSALDASR
ncbi:MAG: GDSL-type esterase/lipase family protein [Kiritimatiellia bacterium]